LRLTVFSLHFRHRRVRPRSLYSLSLCSSRHAPIRFAMHGPISGGITTSTGNAATSADLSLSALQSITVSSSNRLVTIPLAAQSMSTASLTTQAGAGCPAERFSSPPSTDISTRFPPDTASCRTPCGTETPSPQTSPAETSPPDSACIGVMPRGPSRVPRSSSAWAGFSSATKPESQISPARQSPGAPS